MSNDMVLIFNQLIDKELTDCDLFKDILDLHYEKFKYFYKIIEDMDLSSVQKINCEELESLLKIIISFKNKSNRDLFFKDFNSLKDSFSKDYFTLNIDKDTNKINITIINNNIYTEEDIYEDRFDRF
jgi:hypothetical protein